MKGPINSTHLFTVLEAGSPKIKALADSLVRRFCFFTDRFFSHCDLTWKKGLQGNEFHS
jgi:hypothetical protein